MPSIQKIVLALAFAASTFAQTEIADGQIQQITDGQIQQVAATPAIVPAVKQITDGQIQQVTSTPAIVPAVKQITDGQIQQVTSTPVAVVKQITDGQLQQVASASITASVSANATSVTTPSAPSTFHGAASLMSYSKELVAVAIGAAAVFAML